MTPRPKLVRSLVATATVTTLLGAPAVATAVPISDPAVRQVAGTSERDRCARSFDHALTRHLRAITNRDLPALARTVHPGAVLILPSGSIIAGKSAIVDFHRTFFADLTWTQTYTEQARTVTCDTATVVLQTYFVQRDAAGTITYEARNILGLTFTHTRNGWLLLHDQNTRLATTG